MKIKTDQTKFTGKYDKRNLTISESGKYRYPSKKMFVKFLEKYKDVDGVADVWSVQDWKQSNVY